MPGTGWSEQQPTWRAARPRLIADALARAAARPSGNWYVAAASRDIPPGAPFGRTVAGVEVVLWRDASGRLAAGPGACPHLGAPLCDSAVVRGRIVCHWHGLGLSREGGPGWDPVPVHDDGVLAWVRLDGAGGESPLPAPCLPPRPEAAATVDAVTTLEGACEPQDVIANRLDPWHGAWFHPYAFTRLTVVEEPDPDTGDRFVVDVAYRVGSRAAVPVRASFTAPEPRTVVMHIIDGEGASSSVETHATPLTAAGDARPRTAVTEAVLATSKRPGFTVARAAAPLLRPLVRRAAARLWRDDLDYAERRWQLRSQGRYPGS
ncbi:DUF5914 domain-containing protein [Streptomyces sp. TRM 70351]|uniref:DUF5914 domain-containing protein n=1 Tax=Streptomyces sp. TRM 70351 TaxID=3116552 RepID=UPI002E7B6834|nr:DUF5914 domain-containing protein [Streptomyces sp. TRM 70351]MEE1927126.1 DUF5914 domain-containing protein [Streptomyces sp. TRM 70351]